MNCTSSDRPPYAAGLTENLPDLQLGETFPDPPHYKADRCAYYHKTVGMHCGGTRETHAARYLEHEFVEPQSTTENTMTQIETSPYEDQLCAVCGYSIDNEGLCVMDAAHDARGVPTEPESVLPRRSLSEEQQELQRDATTLAYTAIRFCPELRDKLSGDEWEAKAAVYGWLIVEWLNNLIDEDLTALNAADEEMDSWLSK